MAKYQSTKIFDNYSVAIRQWKASHSHCELLHGYALKFKVWFESNTPNDENDGLDDMNWIVDYGGFKDTPKGNGLKSCAKMVYEHFNEVLSKTDAGRCKVVKVECFENDKNSSIYYED